MRFQKKPVIIEATQWFKNGDHPQDDCHEMRAHSNQIDLAEMNVLVPDPAGVMTEGRVVRHFRRPDVSGTKRCQYCGLRMHDHGWIDTLEGGHIVCPGDWVITGVAGERYPCKPDIFIATYDAVAPEKTIPETLGVF